MESQQNKRRRVYSMEPNKIVLSIFARKYLSYLVPALMKIKENTSSTKDHNDINKIVKYEVDMAMVLSAQGFAWSNGLKVKLQREHVNNVATTSTILGMEKDLVREDNEDEDKKMKNLISLIPGGGEEICDEQVVNELESYIKCLQMQVNVLQCLLEETC
jgi:hypothetical protein